MAKYTLGTLDEWAKKCERRLEAVVKQTTNNAVVKHTQTAPGKTRGGSVIPGRIPKDTGFLAASQMSTLNGSTMGEGEDSYVIAIVSFEIGDTIGLGWTAEYARKLHYDGWLWVDTLVSDWNNEAERVIRQVRETVG